MSRSRAARNFPHEGVYARLGCSPIHGVGVFAIRDIPEGTPLFAHDNTDVGEWVPEAVVSELPPKVRDLYRDFAVFKKRRRSYGCPQNFNQLTVSWYLNCSKTPNVACNEVYEFYALRDIKDGEELTVDYSTYSDEPPS